MTQKEIERYMADKFHWWKDSRDGNYARYIIVAHHDDLYRKVSLYYDPHDDVQLHYSNFTFRHYTDYALSHSMSHLQRKGDVTFLFDSSAHSAIAGVTLPYRRDVKADHFLSDCNDESFMTYNGVRAGYYSYTRNTCQDWDSCSGCSDYGWSSKDDNGVVSAEVDAQGALLLAASSEGYPAYGTWEFNDRHVWDVRRYISDIRSNDCCLCYC